MSKIIDEIKAKINGFMNYLEVSKAIAEDIVKNKKNITDIDKKIMKYRQNNKTINDIKNDIKRDIK